jgi:hypothetical protein
VIGSQLWLPPGDVVELNPAFFSSSAAVSTDGHQQVGYGYTEQTRNTLLWSGSADTAVDLHPSFAGFDQSNASGAGGGRQVGRMFMGQGVSYVEHAVLWSGSAESAIDLHPAGFKTSVATATNGEQQVGSGYLPVIRRTLCFGKAQPIPQSISDLTTLTRLVGAVSKLVTLLWALWASPMPCSGMERPSRWWICILIGPRRRRSTPQMERARSDLRPLS